MSIRPPQRARLHPDHLRFAKALRIVRTAARQLIGADGVTFVLRDGQFGAPAQGGIGFGLGVQVVEDPVLAGRNVSKGAWGWAGAYGTNVQIEAAEKMVTIIMMQVSTGALLRDFEAAVQQAIVQ